MKKENLDLVLISSGYIEDSSIANFVFVLVNDNNLNGKQIAKKFVKDVSEIYLEEYGRKVKKCCLNAKVKKKKYCPDCGTKIEGSCGIETEQFDFEDFIRTEITATCDSGYNLWWDGELMARGWFIWKHDFDVLHLNRIVSISCIEAAVKDKDVRLDIKVTELS